MSDAVIFALEAFAPVAIFILYLRIKNAKARRRGVGAETATVPAFDPKPEPTPGFFLRLFSTPQRAYLRQQIALGKGFYYVATYIFVAMFTAGLFPTEVDRYGFEQPLAQRVWYSYLKHISGAEIVLGFMMGLAAVIATNALTEGTRAIFSRTRPLTQRFLFWARILSTLASIVASLATAAAVSFVLLFIFYGPVWLHLLDTPKPGTVLSHQQGIHFIQVLQTSAPRLFLSLITTLLLAFSVAILLANLSSWFPKKSAGKAVILPFGIVGGIFAVHLAELVNAPSGSLWSHVLFLYIGLGPPPLYAYVFVPILASAALLFFAQHLARKIEL